jgi:hypothetical protein
MSFDIVIPLGPKEISRFYQQIEFTKKNVTGYRNIYIVTCNLNVDVPGCTIVDENIFPFKDFISEYFFTHNGKKNRNGWYFQQLVKLYAGVYIENILDNYLVVDADVFFMKPINFMENDKPIFTLGDEHHIPYFIHMNVLHENLLKSHDKSGICHHMLFSKKYINEIFELVEEKHKNPFWQVFILSVQEHKNHSLDADDSGASEYEIYFNYMVKYHNNNIVTRNLTWGGVSINDYESKRFNQDSDYISVCAWMG